MTNNTITVMKKELARFFGDRRLVITTLLLPGIMISGSCTSEITRDTFCFIPVDKSLTRTWANS